MPFCRPFVNNKGSVESKSSSSQGLMRKMATVSLMTLLSRVLGFLRDVILANAFGAGVAFDAFIVAFKIPNFFRRLFGEGAFSQAFVPVLAKFTATAEHAEIKTFVNHIFTSLSLALLVLVAIGQLCGPLFIMIFAPGFAHGGARYGLAVHMLRITFPYILLISLTALSGAILNTHKRFALPAFAPVLLNVALITAAVCLSPHLRHPVVGLAYGVVIGGVLQLCLQLPAISRLGLLPAWRLNWRDPLVSRVLKMMVPALFGVSVAQISLLIDNCFASFLPAGSISWLYYSDRLTYLPLGVIGVALATVVLPSLAIEAKNLKEPYSKTLAWALHTALIVGIPAAIGLLILAQPVLATLFLHGSFLVQDVIMASRSLRAFALGLPAFILIKVLASAYYSRQDIKTPVRVAAISLLVNIIGNFSLIHSLQHAGLALATSIAAYVNALLLLGLLIKRRLFVVSPKAWFSGLRLVLASAVMALVLHYGLRADVSWLHATVMLRVESLLRLIIFGAIAYIATLWLLGWRFRDLRH